MNCYWLFTKEPCITPGDSGSYSAYSFYIPDKHVVIGFIPQDGIILYDTDSKVLDRARHIG